MSLGEFLRGKLLFLLLNLFVAAYLALLLRMMEMDAGVNILLPCLLLGLAFLSLAPEYIVKNRYCREVRSIVSQLDKKFLLAEIIPQPDFAEGRVMYAALRAAGKAMNDEIARHRLSAAGYREYIELWVHEIKTPIAAARLVGENARNEAALAELAKIDFFVEQALYYARGATAEKDYLIRRTTLSELVAAVLKNNARFLIGHKIAVHMENLELAVFTDSKWVMFILRQIIDNSVKYGCSSLEFAGRRGDNNVSLLVRDDGAGIPEQDINRVFDKGFTGANGRRFGRSTGLGLYLCQNLCQKLGLELTAASGGGAGTEMEIVFPVDERLAETAEDIARSAPGT
ncbi:MAG: sensor histidine kinase [Gracilibacteraceae bacterium]|jgi:signal transduction histidine kinase|nr:sensor histidine kinase [Gracilibacteraceae bacterium]